MEIEKSSKLNYITWFIYSQFYFNSERSIKKEIRIWAVLILHCSVMNEFQLP